MLSSQILARARPGAGNAIKIGRLALIARGRLSLAPGYSSFFISIAQFLTGHFNENVFERWPLQMHVLKFVPLGIDPFHQLD